KCFTFSCRHALTPQIVDFPPIEVSGQIRPRQLDGAAVGIAKKVIGENSLDGLSAKQKGIYENVIYPQMKVDCSGGCGGTISMDMAAEAIRNQAAGEDFFCVDCEYSHRDRGDD
ncbi:hypothetical protein, partial [Pseudoduganella violacea]